jgi:hypothetical protein
VADVTAHLAFPLRFRAGRFLSVEQGSRRHLEDQAELLLRTRPGTLEADPSCGLRDLAGTLGPTAPEVLAALERNVAADFTATEGALERVRDVVAGIAVEDAAEEG